VRGGPSRTALGAARHRAAHQVVDGAILFEDPLALPIAGFGGPDEVDHPATQAWKRRRLAEIGVTEPAHLSYVPVDLESDDLAAALRGAGYRQDGAAIVLWLGVLPYLTTEAVAGTLRTLAALGPVEVVFDYGEPPGARAGPARDEFERAAARVADAGEPWITFLTPVHLRRLLAGTGLALVEDIDVVSYVAAVLRRPDPGRRSPAHLVHARRTVAAPGPGMDLGASLPRPDRRASLPG